MSADGFFAEPTTIGRITSVAGDFANAGVFFPAANLCNFMQGANPVATKIALGNLAYSGLLVGTSAILKRLPDVSPTRKFCDRLSKAINDTTPTTNPLKLAFRLVGRELSDPLRVTSYCALAISGFLLASAKGGTGIALFPGLAGLFFGIGNFIQSSPAITRFRSDPQVSQTVGALLHPAVWYGLGYTMTGIGIGGGISLITNPLHNTTAALLTSIGIAETAGALGLMVSGKVTNQAAPFVGVAIGTGFFAATGIVTGNFLGAATGAFACAGELSLAVLMQKLHNAEQVHGAVKKPASRIESFLTFPVRAAMKRRWIVPVP